MAYLLSANVVLSAAEELCQLQEAVKTPGLLQAKSALWTKSLLDVEDGHPRRHSPMTSRFFSLEDRDSRLSLSTVWPFIALTMIFLLFTFILVNHEALLKRFGGLHAERGVPDKVPLEPEASGDFCPDLIVPAGCECILIVPSRPKRGEPFNITDNNGSTVLTVADDEGSAGSAFPRRALVAGGLVLAKCGRAESSVPSSMVDRAIDFELISSKGDVWAELKYEPREGSEEQDRCTIKSKTGRQLLVMGSVRHNALNVTDHHGGLLATTEPMTSTGPVGHAPGTIFRLRIAPQADVGLVLCALICLQHLSTQ